MLFELIKSASLMLSLALLYGFIVRKWPKDTPLSTVITGCLFGFICIFGMTFPVEILPGVIFDSRSVILTLASVFGGTLVGLISGLFSAFYRLWLGGDGAAVGVTIIILSVGIGLIYRELHKRKKFNIDAVSLLTLGAIVNFLYISLLLFLPSDIGPSVLRSITIPLILTLVPATPFVGLIFKAIDDDYKNREEIKKLTKDKAAALEKVIHVLSAALETRDLYTAGHEQNVAKIAVEIGKKLGYGESQLEGLELAGTIHDVGKIQIPTEILAKPAKLRPQEFELVKLHPDVGADLLLGIEFDWPIAEIIRQHHERLDGTGYPKGLRGDQIMDEAKVIAVADTLDAVASHRPYRAALGIDAACEVLKEGRGTHFDPKVVDACLELIKTNVISFP